MKTVFWRGSGGFTLLEVMVAIVILAIALLGLAGLQVISVGGNSLATQITEATTLAQDQLEQLITTPFATLVALGTVANNVVGVTGVTYNVQYIVVPDAGGSRADVNVTVTWTQTSSHTASNTHTVAVNSVISQF